MSEASITWKSKSDSILSSKVDLKALISAGGRSRINQIVSLIRISLPRPVSGSVIIYNFPTFVQSVAKSLSSASAHFLVSALSKVDFPALVYPTIPTVGSHFLILESR